MAKKVTRKRQPSDSNGQVTVLEGEIVIDVKGGPHDGKTIRMDPLLLMLAAEPLERKHKLEIDDRGFVVASAAFIKDFDAALRNDLGYESTPAVALGAWQAAHEYHAELKKKRSA